MNQAEPRNNHDFSSSGDRSVKHGDGTNHGNAQRTSAPKHRRHAEPTAKGSCPAEASSNSSAGAAIESHGIETSAAAPVNQTFQQWVQPPLHGCWYLTGPTASGKTPLALELAKRLEAEILSLDSMAIYRGMDIGTAKPSAAEQAEVPHHLIDILDPVESYSVSAYCLAAREAAAQIHRRGKRVLIVGGTPLYLKSLLRGFFLGPPADWEFRHAVEEDIRRFGEQALNARLRQVDPLLATKLHPNDHRRIIRALEVAKVTGFPLSHWQQQFEVPASPKSAPVIRLTLERSRLHDRINGRVDAMLREGLIDEVQGLLDRFGKLGRTAAQAVGYREVLAHLHGGVSLPETVESIKAHTRQFARRQEIWFRGLQELQPVDVESFDHHMKLVDKVADLLRSSTCQPLANH